MRGKTIRVHIKSLSQEDKLLRLFEVQKLNGLSTCDTLLKYSENFCSYLYS